MNNKQILKTVAVVFAVCVALILVPDFVFTEIGDVVISTLFIAGFIAGIGVVACAAFYIGYLIVEKIVRKR